VSIESGKIPLISLEDVGNYSLWLFENLSESAGLDLKVTTDEVSFADIAATFTEVTGKKGVHKYVPPEEYFPAAEPYSNAPASWAAGPNAVRDESSMTWRENFTAWWKYWGEGKCTPRDMQLLDRILPGRIKSLEDWMRKVEYDGQPKNVLKGIEDLKRNAQQVQQNGGSN
jgi:hypothetical protein